MLEVTQRDGRGRIVRFEPKQGPVASTPALVHIATDRFGPAVGASWRLVRAADDGGGVQLVSGGTWFHPRDADGNDAPHGLDGPLRASSSALFVPPVRPAPSGVVQVASIGDEVAVWHDAVGWSSDPKHAVPALVHTAREASPARLLWAAGLGTPADYAVWVAAGVDLFDASPLLLAATRGVALTTDGPASAANMARIHADDASDASDASGAAWDTDRLAAFNLAEAERELRRIRLAIGQGTLRALAERRASASPHTLAVLRRLDRDHQHIEAATGVFRGSTLQCNTLESLHGAEVERFRARLRNRYRAPASADVLVVLPCSATKPYRLSPSHRWFGRALDDSGIRHRVHEVMVTAPLGVVPRELEQTSPARDYDIPVTGKWTRDEEAVIRQQLAHLLMAGDYRHVVAHVPESTFTFLRDLLPDTTVHTAHTDHPQRKKECDRLRDALRTIKKADPKPAGRGVWQQRKVQDFQALASWQFGPDAAAALVEGAGAAGRSPYVKLTEGPSRDAPQLAMATDRGLISLTLGGADRIAGASGYRVIIGDFPLASTGSLFAPGVTAADPDIRPGDSVAIVQGGRVVACGQAQMSAEEMVASKRGVAVVMKHVRTALTGKPATDAEPERAAEADATADAEVMA